MKAKADCNRLFFNYGSIFISNAEVRPALNGRYLMSRNFCRGGNVQWESVKGQTGRFSIVHEATSLEFHGDQKTGLKNSAVLCDRYE